MAVQDQLEERMACICVELSTPLSPRRCSLVVNLECGLTCLGGRSDSSLESSLKGTQPSQLLCGPS